MGALIVLANVLPFLASKGAAYDAPERSWKNTFGGDSGT
jgi:hypothetical protein